jgi:hypothetical protein
MLRTFVVVLVSSVVAACGGDDGTIPEMPVFGPDYTATYQEVRNCRFSLDHDLGYIRVLAAPDAVTTYTTRTGTFTTGAILLKEEYDGDDTSCAGPILTFSVMQKLDDETSPDTLDWTWQKVDKTASKVVTEDRKRCLSCHRDCGVPPEGYLNTCAVP